MKIILNHSSMVPIYEQLINQIKTAIANGELKAGSALPSVRNLAAELRISALTVKKAYDRLEEEGILVTVHGKGSFVSERNLEFIKESRRHEVEVMLSEAVERAKTFGMSDDEIRQLIDIILED
jgi:GntR family transcriptional regulator